MKGTDMSFEFEDKMTELEYEYLTPKEVMAILCIGRNKFYELVNSGKLPASRIGKLWRVKRNDIEALFT